MKVPILIKVLSSEYFAL